MKKTTIIILALVILTATLTGFTVLMNTSSLSSIHNADKDNRWIDGVITANSLPLNILGQTGTITIHAVAPDVPASFPLYKGTLSDENVIDLDLGDLTSLKNSVTSEEEAPGVAEQVMASYGGIPSDAVLVLVNTSYAKKINGDTGEVMEKWPVSTSVAYHRNLNGMPIVGDGDRIHIDLGENGEPLWIVKIWRTLEYTGSNVSIISPQQAIEKLQNGESINHLMTDQSTIITNISLGVYEKSRSDPQIFLEPVWIFSGTTPSRNRVSFYVYARQFANFTAIPTYGKEPLTVTFTDTSDASPTKWNWDFGDGTTSTDQNPVHTFQTAGAYTVTLKVWNDLGSDTMVKTSFILTGKKAIVMHIDTMLDELKKTLNAMNIAKGNKNSLMQKLENAQKKNGDALKFIDQNKEAQANNMLNAEDNMMNAFMNEVNAQTGKAISTGDAAKLKNGATKIRGFIQKAIETPI
jgi:uncharacterized membrane protein